MQPRLTLHNTSATMDLLLSQEPAQAGYPAADERISRLWFKLGFTSALRCLVPESLP